MSDDLSKVDWAYFARGGTLQREKWISVGVAALRNRYARSALERDSREG